MLRFIHAMTEESIVSIIDRLARQELAALEEVQHVPKRKQNERSGKIAPHDESTIAEKERNI